MRWIAPLTGAAVTSMLLLTAATVAPRLVGAEADAAAARGPGPVGGACVTVVDPPVGTSGAFGITDGPGGIWFSHGDTVDRIEHRRIEEFEVPDGATANSGTLAWRPGGPVWFADRGNSRIGSIDRRGRVRTFDIPHAAGVIALPQGIVIGPGGDVWFTDQAGNTVNRLDTRSGRIEAFPVPTPNSSPLGLTRGTDGALWFTERSAAKVGRLAADGAITEWALEPGAFPNRITVGPDRAIWFTELNAGKIGRIDAAGVLTEFTVTGGPVGITAGPGKALYVTLFTDKALVRVDTNGAVTGRWDLPGAGGPIQTIAARGAVWVTDPTSDTVYRVRPSCQ